MRGKSQGKTHREEIYSVGESDTAQKTRTGSRLIKNIKKKERMQRKQEVRGNKGKLP